MSCASGAMATPLQTPKKGKLKNFNPEQDKNQNSSSIASLPPPKMSDLEDDGILNIEVSDAEDTPAEKKAKRTGQSEAEFQAVRATYVTKIQNGNVRLDWRFF